MTPENEMLTKQLTDAMTAKINALTAVTDALDTVELATIALKRAENAALIACEDPKTMGANEAQRAAKLAEITAKEIAAKITAERELRQLRLDLEITSLCYDTAKTICKLAGGE